MYAFCTVAPMLAEERRHSTFFSLNTNVLKFLNIPMKHYAAIVKSDFLGAPHNHLCTLFPKYPSH